MSHYSVAVITKTDKIDELQKLLAPFDEHIEVEPYICRTKEDMIEFARSVKRKFEVFFNKFESKYVAAETDEDLYNCVYSEDSIYDEDGNELSTYNPNSKWDKYYIGGRYSYQLRRINSSTKYNQLQLKYIDFTDFFTNAILTPDGQWLESKDLVVNIKCFNIFDLSEEEKEWKENYAHYYDNINPDYYVTIVDCHIC